MALPRSWLNSFFPMTFLVTTTSGAKIPLPSFLLPIALGCATRGQLTLDLVKFEVCRNLSAPFPLIDEEDQFNLTSSAEDIGDPVDLAVAIRPCQYRTRGLPFPKLQKTKTPAKQSPTNTVTTTTITTMTTVTNQSLRTPADASADQLTWASRQVHADRHAGWWM